MFVKFGKCVLIVFLCMMWTILPAVSAEKEQASDNNKAVEEKGQTSDSKSDKKADDENKDDKVAVVNGRIITRGEFERAIAPVQQQIAMQGQKVDDEKFSEVKKNILENLINVELLYQESQKTGIKVDSAAVDKKFEELKSQFPDDTRFQNAMKELNLTEDKLISHIKEGLAVQQFIDANFTDKITISDKDVKSYYDSHKDFFKQAEQIKASHILIKSKPDAEEADKVAARKKIEDIQEKLKKGEDFEVLAKAHSEGPSNVRGGDLGYFGHGQMVKQFEDTAFSMKVGQISDIVETRFGYHLIKLVDKKPEGTMPYEEVKEKLQDYLKEEKVQKEVNLHVEKLKQKAEIERYL